MLALLRLAAFAFLYGGSLVCSVAAIRLLLHLFLPLPADFPSRLRERLPQHREQRLPRLGRRMSAVARFLSDLFLVLGIAVSFVLFLFWGADGIPRLFILISAVGGALVTYRLLRSSFRRVERGALFLTRLFFLFLCLPILSAIRRIVGCFLSFLQKPVCFFIKCIERQNTKHRARRYEKRAVHTLVGARMRARLLGALDGSDGRSA